MPPKPLPAIKKGAEMAEKIRKRKEMEEQVSFGASRKQALFVSLAEQKESASPKKING